MKKGLLLFLCAALSACSLGVRQAPSETVYDFGLPATPLVARHSWLNLDVDVVAPPWLHSSSLEYRLPDDEKLQRQRYLTSRWAASPARLLTESLRQQLAIVGGSSTDCRIRVELQEFAQVFDSSQTSHALIKANVVLIDAERKLLDVQRVTVEIPASSADAPGGAKALVKAARRLGEHVAIFLVSWLGTEHRNSALAQCPLVKPAVSEFVVKQAEFGRIRSLNTSDYLIEPTTVIPLRAGVSYGWKITLDTNKKNLRWKEELTLPAAPKHWGIDPSVGKTTISTDRRTSTTEREEFNHAGVISNSWAVAPGDPKGLYRLRVFVEGQEVRNFEFTLE